MLIKKVMLLICSISSIGIIEGNNLEVSNFHRRIIVVKGCNKNRER